MNKVSVERGIIIEIYELKVKLISSVNLLCEYCIKLIKKNKALYQYIQNKCIYRSYKYARKSKELIEYRSGNHP